MKSPTQEEVTQYITERGSPIDPIAFWAHYEANGWVQGKYCKPIKKWQACVITWERELQKNKGNSPSVVNRRFDTSWAN